MTMTWRYNVHYWFLWRHPSTRCYAVPRRESRITFFSLF